MQSACDAQLGRTAWTRSDACVRHAPSRAEALAAVARFLHLPVHRTALGLRASVMRGRGQHSRVEACELLLPRNKTRNLNFKRKIHAWSLKTFWYKMPCALKTARRMRRRELLLLLRRRTPPPRRRRRRRRSRRQKRRHRPLSVKNAERDLFFFRSPVTLRP